MCHHVFRLSQGKKQNRPWKSCNHDDVIKWKHFPRDWPFVRGIHRSPVNSPHKGQWRGALMFTLICVWINGCVNNREAGDLRRYCVHYGVTVMMTTVMKQCTFNLLISNDIAQNEMVLNNLIIHHLIIITCISYENVFTTYLPKLINIAPFQTCVIRVTDSIRHCNTDFSGFEWGSVNTFWY